MPATDRDSEVDQNFLWNLSLLRTEPIREETSTSFNGTAAAHVFQSIFTPMLLFVGLVGNSVSLVMLRRRSLRSLTTCFYLSCLSVADLFCLCFGLFPVFLLTVTSGSINARAWMDCKLMDFLTYLSTDISIWIVVTMTIDRYISTCHPVISIKICNKKVAKRLVVAVAGIMLVVNGHLAIFYTFGVEDNSTTDSLDCIPTPQSSYFFHTIWPWIDFTFYSLLPDSMIFIFNFLIIRSIILKRKKAVNCASRNFRRQTFKMTKTLIVVSTVTLLCTSPITIIQIAEEYDKEHENKDISWNLAFTIGNLLMYTNHSINFVLFCLTGSRFRRELLLMLGIRHNAVQTSTVNTRPEQQDELTV